MKTNLHTHKLGADFKIAFLSVFIIGLLAHIYKFTNTLPNHDALYSLYTTNNVISSGRWFLAVASAPSSTFDLPWINGIISLFWIGLTAGVLVDYFDLRNKVSIIICSGLLVTFPSVVNTFSFEFTADAYFLSMFLAALAARLSMLGKNDLRSLLLAALCICLSCGIYQAYVSFSLLMAVCHFMIELLKGNHNNKDYCRWIFNQILIYVLGLAAYYVIFQLCMAVQNVRPSGYAGINALLTEPYSASNLIIGFKTAFRTLAYFFLSRNVFVYGWTLYAALNVVFLVSLSVAVILVAIKTKIWNNPIRLILFLLCIVAIPVFACIWSFVSAGQPYHLLMLQSLCILYIFALTLAVQLLKPSFGKFICILLALLTVKFTVQANQVYFEMNLSMEKSRATGIEMMTRIHQVDDGSIKKIAIIGSIEQSLVGTGRDVYDEIWVNGHQIRTNLVYDHIYGNLFLNQFMDSHYIPVSDVELQSLANSNLVEQMSEWPLKDSVLVIDDVVIIKLSASPEQQDISH